MQYNRLSRSEIIEDKFAAGFALAAAGAVVGVGVIVTKAVAQQVFTSLPQEPFGRALCIVCGATVAFPVATMIAAGLARNVLHSLSALTK